MVALSNGVDLWWCSTFYGQRRIALLYAVHMGRAPGLSPVSRHLGRDTDHSMSNTPPVGSLPSCRRQIRSLTVIKQDARLWTIPIVVFTTAAQPHDIDVCYQLSVNSYMVKPMDCERLRYALELLMRYWFRVVTLPERRSQ